MTSTRDRGAEHGPFDTRQEPALYWRVRSEFRAALERLGWPDRHALDAPFEGHGAGGRSEGRRATAVLAVPGREERLHLRPVRHGGLLGPLWGPCILGFQRPLRELDVTERLAAAGAPVPRAISVVAHRRLGPLWQAVFATEHVADADDGLAWLARRPARHALVDGARAVGAAVRRFHDAGGRHPDLHIKNLLFRASEAGPEVLVIDLDGAHAGTAPPPSGACRS